MALSLRLRRRPGRHALTGVLVLALLGLLGGEAGAESRSGRGDFGLYLETFSQPGAEGRTRLLMAVQLPVGELAWEEQGDSLVARIRCRWSLHALGEVAAAVDEDLPLLRKAGQPLVSMLYLREVDVPGGEYRLELECEDLGRRIGSLGRLFGHHPRSELSSTVTARDFSAGGVLGDPLTFRVLPDGKRTRFNPSGAYMLGEDALELQTTFAPPAARDEGGHFGLELELRDAEGELRQTKRGAWNYAAGELLPLRFRLPLSALEPGHYRLQLRLHGQGLDDSVSECRLDLLGGEGVSDAELARRSIEAQLFLSSEAYQEWQRLPAWNRVAAMESFWARQDPSPGSAENPVYDEFLRRFAVAQERYTVFQAGALSDRGRLLIRYGEPSSVEAETMPMNRTGLTNAVRGMHGESEVEPGISPYELDPSQPRDALARNSELARDVSRIGTGSAINFGVDSEPYEVWTYALGGEPLLPIYRLHLRGVSLKVIFVDESGYGDYTLVYRSEDFDF